MIKTQNHETEFLKPKHFLNQPETKKNMSENNKNLTQSVHKQ